MSAPGAVLPLLVFEAADCLMAVPAAEIARMDKNRGSDPINGATVDLGEYFMEQQSDGPWLYWTRGTRHAWLRVRRVVDVVPVSLAALTRMPAVLGEGRGTRAFVAAGLRGDDVFLLLDPGRLA